MRLTILCMFMMVVHMTSGKLACLDEHGNPVDMFVLYKLPEITRYHVPHAVQSGRAYVYLDSNDKSFRYGNYSITIVENAAGLTLDQVYKKHFYFHQGIKMKTNRAGSGVIKDLAHVFYNDANPEGKEFFTYGHTKGALAFDDESGFWLISSVPRFPNRGIDGYAYPHTGFKFGQMMMCVTFNSKAFNQIGMQMLYNNPHVHDSYIPKEWEEDYGNIKRLIDGEYIDELPYTSIAELVSQGGIKYTHFAKSGGFDSDLYFSLVAPHLKSNLLTETWQHGHNIGPSCHSSHNVLDVTSLNITVPTEVNDLYFAFKNYNDHSKFALGDSEENPVVCVGDINRQPSQFHRGGGTMCVSDVDLWKQFRLIVKETTYCGRDEL